MKKNIKNHSHDHLFNEVRDSIITPYLYFGNGISSHMHPSILKNVVDHIVMHLPFNLRTVPLSPLTLQVYLTILSGCPERK